MSFNTKILLIGLITLITGCTTQDPYTGQQTVSKTAAGAGIGAAGGAIIGAIAGKGTGALIGAGVGAAVGGVAGNMMDRQAAALRQQLQSTGVQVVQDPSGDIHLIMPGDITFAFNSTEIKANFYSTLNSVAIVLRKYNQTIVHVDGFTDNVGESSYNQRLSERRAEAVAQYLMGQGVHPNRFAVRGFGDRRPVASNSTPSGRAMNRRVEITIHAI
ncbi:MAG: OmpA family protein [Proteobacteria bacterium]|nr:OmpA family protein [Pseudomonadota bacterium]